MPPQQQGDLVVLQEDPLAVFWDPLRNGDDVVGLAADSHGRRIADAVHGAAAG